MLESILGFFFLPVVFWLVVLFLSIVYMASVENDRYTFSVVATVIAIVIYYKPLIAILSNWQLTLIFGFGYLIAGALWSIFRWYRHCKKYVEKANKKDKTLKEIRDSMELSVAYNKSQIIGWIVYWPWSFLWNVIGDVVTAIYDGLRGIYEKISNKVIEGAFK